MVTAGVGGFFKHKVNVDISKLYAPGKSKPKLAKETAVGAC
jgi:hypothetical protein